MRSLTLFLLSAILLFAISCRKGDLPENHYFSKVQVYDLAFTNSPDIDVRFGKKLLGTISTSKDAIYELLTAKDTLKIYKSNTDTLLADTLVNLSANSMVTFRFAYSPDMGLKGFIPAAAAVPAHTIAFQLLNNLGDFYKSYSSLELHICYYDYNTGEILETGNVIDNFQNVDLYPRVFRLPFWTPEGYNSFYLGKIKDKTTGEFIIQPGAGVDYFFLPSVDGGTYSIFNVQDVNGDVAISTIPL